MLTIAALLNDWPPQVEQPAVRLIGAAPLAALMAAAREELGRERASSRVAAAPNSALATGSAPVARVERR
ncbi:MAG: hypothetical protein AB7G40_15740 [Hyphomonadaceae bacterium]